MGKLDGLAQPMGELDGLAQPMGCVKILIGPSVSRPPEI